MSCSQILGTSSIRRWRGLFPMPNAISCKGRTLKASHSNLAGLASSLQGFNVQLGKILEARASLTNRRRHLKTNNLMSSIHTVLGTSASERLSRTLPAIFFSFVHQAATHVTVRADTQAFGLPPLADPPFSNVNGRDISPCSRFVSGR